MRRTIPIVGIVLALALQMPLAGTASSAPQPVPDVADGFSIHELVPVDAPTAINFGPGDDDGPDLYATTLTGRLVRVHLLWTPVGPAAEDVSVVADDLNLPLGVAFDGTTVFVSDSRQSDAAARTVGHVTAFDLSDPSDRTRVVDQLPNGRHNTNHLRFGPDGDLYIANGNPNDDGVEGGAADIHPYSGAILSVNASFVLEHPQVLQWRDADGDLIPADEIADHPRNEDFAGNVTSVAHGFRNVFGVAFGPDDRPWTAMNGADDPSSQDSLYRITPGTDYGFPRCYNEGTPGATTGISKRPNPQHFPDADCSTHPPADALLGWHTCTTGIDFPTDGAQRFPPGFRNSTYIGECSVFFGADWLQKVSQDPTKAQHSTSHKVARVVLDGTGDPIEVRDFVTGLALPTDVRFGPEGAMYIADAGAIYHVAPTPRTTVTVQAVGTQFFPETVVVPTGTTVRWEAAVLSHTVTTADTPVDAAMGNANDPSGDNAFDALLPQGSSFEHTFTASGTYPYFCHPHHGFGMVGEVVVV